MEMEFIAAARQGRLEEVNRLLESGVDVNAKDSFHGQTAISWAAERGHLEVVQTLYRHGASIDIRDKYDHTPVYWAIRHDRHDILSFFLADEKNTSHKYHNGRTFLFVAAGFGSVEDVQLFLKAGLDPNTRDNEGLTPLMFAVQQSRKDNVTALLEAGADPLLEDNEHRNALFYVFGTTDYALAEMLLAKVDGSCIDGKAPGARPLIEAAKIGDVKMIRLLLYRKADPQLPDEDDMTPLYWAAKKGHVDAVCLLIDAGADPYKLCLQSVPSEDRSLAAFVIAATNDIKKWQEFANTKPDLTAKDSDGKTSLHLAVTHGISATAIEWMISAGYEVDARDVMGRTPLILASRYGRASTVDTLLRNHADAKLVDTDYDETPLMWAAEHGHDEVVKRLCPESDINARGWRGRTAILFAAINGSVGSVEALINAGANLKVFDEDYGQSPLSWAAENNHLGAVQALIKAGADLYSVESHGREPVAFALGNKEIVQAFIEQPNESRDPGEEPTPRVRMAELVLRYRWENSQEPHEVSSFILNNEDYLKAKDHHSRNLVSWAAQGGKYEVMQKLCEKDLDLNLRDMTGRTPLSWAAGSGVEPVVQLLLGKPDIDKAADNDGCTLLHWAVHSGNPDTVKRLLEQEIPLDSKDKAGRTPLSWAAAEGHRHLTGLLLSQKAAKDSEDREKRTALSWAAESGHDECVRLLLEKGASVKTKDSNDRSPLSWAAEGGHDNCVQLLLSKGADPDSKDTNRKTPLSWAAENGHLGVVKTLLALRGVKARSGDNGENRSKKDARVPDGKRAGVEVNSRDNKLRTPLWYAAKNHHLTVFETLLLYGATPDTRDIDDKTLIEVLVEKIQGIQGPATQTWKAMLEKLKSSGSLWREPRPDAASVDKEFSATVVYVSKSDELDIDHRMPSVESLLQGEHLLSPHGATCAWMHLPANNMRWVEALMAKRYEVCGENESWKSDVVLKPRFWVQQQHKSQEGPYHARFMRPACHPIVIRERWGTTKLSQEVKPKESKPKKESKTPKSSSIQQEGQSSNESGQPKKSESKQEEPDSTDVKTKREKNEPKSPEAGQEGSNSTRGLVLFMPYLHWELQAQQNKLKDIMETKKSLHREDNGESLHRDRVKEELAKGPDEICGTEKLYWRYLDEEHPLHARRTLDQFYYHTLTDTKKRDEDQAVIRYYKDRNKKKALEEQPVLTMVDQLWMWVLPACGKSPETIITAFPQRSNRMSTNTSKSTTSLVSNIIDRSRELPEKSAGELAQVIAAECSRIYFDNTSSRSELIQFLEIYTTSIGEITERETVRFDEFQANIRKNSEKSMEVASDGEPEGAVNEDPAVLKALLNVENDIEDLRQIKDIREELNIMSSVFHAQKRVLQAMDHVLREPKDRRNGHDGGRNMKRTNSFPLTMASPFGIMDSGVEDRNDQWMYHSPMLEVVNQNIDEVVRLDRFAERALQAIQQLLDLKHQQANLIEEKMTRKLTAGIFEINEKTADLTKGIFQINDKTDKQGNTIMYFTVATIIFLPLSFMASFLTIEVDEFPRGESGHLSLGFVLIIIFTVSVAVIVPSVFAAFNLDRVHRTIKKRITPGSSAMNSIVAVSVGVIIPTLTAAFGLFNKNSAVTNSSPNAWRRWSPKRWWLDRQARLKRHDEEHGRDIAGNGSSGPQVHVPAVNREGGGIDQEADQAPGVVTEISLAHLDGADGKRETQKTASQVTTELKVGEDKVQSVAPSENGGGNDHNGARESLDRVRASVDSSTANEAAGGSLRARAPDVGPILETREGV
ncbi:ankyrin repeat-containing domain protein [Apiosordaria backusii]|uniref:Ankyrin repeat-containing domain protein n=1 Tax=Apiosordaria backusii TaxID=314023 RepID=A0AA40K7I6_9PEZI|nr:ankyrin repeat-containing domain protein [Apiosordaria backusii]